jgi:uncharacterized protein (TIGR00251 family)
MSPPGRPKGEYRSAQHAGNPISPPGRPKGKYRSAQHAGGPVSASWRREERDALILALHVQPGAARTEVAGMHGDALKVRLAAPPVDGKANATLLRFLADAFAVPLRRVTLVRGETSRQKTVRIDAPAARPDRDWMRLD